MHFTYDGDRLVATTPAFLGIAMALQKTEPGRVGLRVLADREDLGRRLVDSLSREHVERARLDTSPDESRIGSRDERAKARSSGIAGAELPGEQLALLTRLVQEYTRDLDRPIAEAHERLIDPKRARFAFSGEAKPGAELYYRVVGPEFTIEFHRHNNHVHSLWRRNDDFGRSG